MNSNFKIMNKKRKHQIEDEREGYQIQKNVDEDDWENSINVQVHSQDEDEDDDDDSSGVRRTYIFDENKMSFTEIRHKHTRTVSQGTFEEGHKPSNFTVSLDRSLQFDLHNDMSCDSFDYSAASEELGQIPLPIGSQPEIPGTFKRTSSIDNEVNPADRSCSASNEPSCFTNILYSDVLKDTNKKMESKGSPKRKPSLYPEKDSAEVVEESTVRTWRQRKSSSSVESIPDIFLSSEKKRLEYLGKVLRKPEKPQNVRAEYREKKYPCSNGLISWRSSNMTQRKSYSNDVVRNQKSMNDSQNLSLRSSLVSEWPRLYSKQLTKSQASVFNISSSSADDDVAGSSKEITTSAVNISSVSKSSSTSSLDNSTDLGRASFSPTFFKTVLPCYTNVAHNYTENSLVQNTISYNSPRKVDKEREELMTKQYKPGFIDTHCHLDFLFQRNGHTGSYAKFQELCKDKDPFPVSYEGCVAIFCKPWTFKKISWWEEIITEPNVWAAFGCHPHYSDSFGDIEEGYLRHAIQNSNVIAVGEIGLDYSSKNSHERGMQIEVFRRQVQIAIHFKKPLVIHCREAHRDCIQILKEMVPKDYLIHRHCFTEDWDYASEWLESFDNAYLGFTALLTYNRNSHASEIRQVVRRMPLNRILLETDAPYFRPHHLRQDGCYHSHPGMAIHVAAQIASLRNIDIEMVLRQVRENTRNMYGI